MIKLKETNGDYSIIVGRPHGESMSYFTSSDKDLTGEYKDAVLSEKKFLTWENGCIEMNYVLGVFAL